MRQLEFVTPPGFEAFHPETSDPAPALEIPPPAEPDIARILTAIHDYGAEIVGPPLGPKD